MTSGSDDQVRFVIAGCLNRDFIIPISGLPQIDVFGGNLAYAAVGLNLWGGTAGILSQVGEDYPTEWLDRLQSLGFDLSGISVQKKPIDARCFMAHIDSKTTHYHSPVQHFADQGLTYPPSLLGYQSNNSQLSSRSIPSDQFIRISEIPEPYLEASAIHLCPIDYASHLILPSIFRHGRATTITLSPDPGYMDPSFWEEIPGLLSDITAFITPEPELRALFQGRRTDLWAMAEILGGYGPEFILIQTLSQGCFLFDRESGKRWVIPEYQSNVTDPTGTRDAFAGGFLVGFREHYDPLEAALMGNVAASLVSEGSGVYYALDAMPGLKDARKLALKELVREV